MVKPCRHLGSLPMGKISDRLLEGSAIPSNFCGSCGTNEPTGQAQEKYYACLTCFETFCISSKKGPSHLMNHSHSRNHSIYYKMSVDNVAETECIEDEFFCAVCGGSPKLKESGKKEKINLEKIKGLFLSNRKNAIEDGITQNDKCKDKDVSDSALGVNKCTPPQPKGLVNLGNTCFMNSALQLLAATLQRHGQVQTKTTSALWNSLIYHLEEIYTFTSSTKKKTAKTANSEASVNPKEFLNLLVGKQKKFASMQQQDAHDFLRLLFNSVAPETPQIELFGGKFVSKVICDRCRNVSETVEPFLDISLSITSGSEVDSIHSSLSNLSLESSENSDTAISDSESKTDNPSNFTVQNMLRAWNKKILLQGENGYYCENCSPKCNESLQNASLQFFMTPELPPFLILHLQRFKTHYTPVSKGKKSKAKVGYCLDIEKDDSHVEFPHILTIPSECILGGNPATIKYKLYGYIIHEGSSTSCGHYTAVIHSACDESDGKWFYISDTRVKEISKSRALDGESYSPYLLFYQRI